MSGKENCVKNNFSEKQKIVEEEDFLKKQKIAEIQKNMTENPRIPHTSDDVVNWYFRNIYTAKNPKFKKHVNEVVFNKIVTRLSDGSNFMQLFLVCHHNGCYRKYELPTYPFYKKLCQIVEKEPSEIDGVKVYYV